MRRNPQTEAAVKVAQHGDSTHSSAAQASAVRLIRVLRQHYNQVINTEVEATAEAKNAQQYLCDYLTYLTTQNTSFTENVALKRCPAIIATIRTIDHIVKNYLESDKIKALSQMLSIAKTHPGFEKWSSFDDKWSQNQIYNAVEKTKEIVKTSPAETLNLVCAALFDPTHLVAGSGIETDRADRIHSLFSYLKQLFEEEKKGHYTICAAGRQHGILFLLSHIFCEKPHQPPMILIEDQNTFALNALSEFVKKQLDALPDKSSEVVSDWILYQAGMIEREVAPVITFFRKRFPSDQNEHIDIKWKTALDEYLKNQFGAFGLDPATCHSDALADNLIYIQPPTVNPILTDLLTFQPLSVTGFLQPLTEQRNHALETLKTQFKSNTQLTSDATASLYVAESLFQKLYRHRYQALLINADDDAYQAAIRNTQTELKQIFETRSRSQQFEAIQAEYQKQLDQLHKRSHYDLIENIFANGKTIEQNLENMRDAIRKLPEGGANPFLITDDMIERWISENTSTEFLGAIDVSPYEMNRILLHALLTKDSGTFSPKISQAVEFVFSWIVEPEQPTDPENKKALKKAYLSHSTLANHAALTS
jgi:hypothetical protein